MPRNLKQIQSKSKKADDSLQVTIHEISTAYKTKMLKNKDIFFFVDNGSLSIAEDYL